MISFMVDDKPDIHLVQSLDCLSHDLISNSYCGLNLKTSFVENGLDPKNFIGKPCNKCFDATGMSTISIRYTAHGELA